jgi:DNA-directed RNA polymerase subunit alpha
MRVRWRDFELPSAVTLDEETKTREYGKFIIEPFERGFGVTVGNSMRRVLLSALEGAALYAMKVENVPHEFTGIPGVLEDVTDIVLRLKKVRVLVHEGEEARLKIERKKAGTITAGDIECPSNVEILNKDFPIVTLTEDVDFSMALWAKKGRGYVTAEELARNQFEIGKIYLDACFSPVLRVRYGTEATRVGQRTNFDRLVLEVWTNGVVTPEMVLVEAAKILRKHLNPFVQYDTIGHLQQAEGAAMAPGADRSALPETNAELQQKLARNVADLNLTVRARNCLESKSIALVGDLVKLTEADLLKVENLGRTTLSEIKRRLDEWGLTLGMQVPEAAGKVEA